MTNRVRILIADDEPDVLEVARLTLELEGYEVLTASDGQQAVEQARLASFDLLLTDVKMPNIDGLDAFQEIRAIDPNIVGVAMTGYGTMTIAVQALKRGFSDFVIKPFTPDELVNAITRSLEKEQLRRENFRLRALIPLFELSRAFMTETHLASLLEQVVQTGLEETRAARANILLQREEGRFEVAAYAGGPLNDSEQWYPLAEWVLRTGQPLVLDGSQSRVPLPLPAILQGSILVLPMISKERPLGVLLLDKAAGDTPFGEGDAELLNVLAGQAAVAIENARLFEERETAYRELEKMDHMKSEFINIAAHELRTPLSLVLGYAGLLEEEAEGLTREYAGSITQNAMRLRAIVDDMTNLRYLEMNQAQLDLLPVDVRESVTQALTSLERSIVKPDVTIETHFPEMLEPVLADGQKLELVLLNLLSNAYKFSPAEGTITIQVEEEPKEVVVSVNDQGPGIPYSEQPKVWKRFYQIEDSLTRFHGGMGLGLAIVKGMVELHQGRVWVDSTEGEGSTFYFTIPRRGLSNV